MSTLTPAGTGCAENGFPTDHRTRVDAIMGSILKFPVAINCTMPLEFLASPGVADTVMLCSWRADLFVMELPPQETTIKITDAIARKNKRLWVTDLRTYSLETHDPLTHALGMEDMRT